MSKPVADEYGLLMRLRVAFIIWMSQHLRWSYLRSIGNSALAKSALLVPILGYFILYNTQVVDWLNQHSMLGGGAGRVGWRIHFLYFGGCSFALGSLIYAWKCPPMLKKYRDGTDYSVTERSVMDADPRGPLKDMVPEEENDWNAYGRAHGTAQLIVNDKLGDPWPEMDADDRAEFAERRTVLMILYAFTWMDASRRPFRVIVFACYALGTVLVATPTLFTVGQVAWQIVQPSQNRSGSPLEAIPNPGAPGQAPK